MEKPDQILELVQPIRDDLLSGAAEIALRAITIFQTVMAEKECEDASVMKERLIKTARALISAQPAMAPLFHLGNSVLTAIKEGSDSAQMQKDVQDALDRTEKQLCESAALIADHVYDFVPPGEMVFAYSFSSTVVSALLSARAKGRYFRVCCTEARSSLEGRKLAAQLASGGIEVIHTFDNAMGLILPNCSVAFMGCDCIGPPGVVNKVGSWTLAVSCRELKVPLYALAGTEKFVTEDWLFEFEKYERPGAEVWDAAPKGVRVLNQQFELIPFNLITALVTEKGVLKEQHVNDYVGRLTVHDALKLEAASF